MKGFLGIMFLLIGFQSLKAQSIQKRFFNGVSIMQAPDSVLKEHQLEGALLIRAVVPQGTGAAAGLQPGDLLVGVNQFAVRTINDLRSGPISQLRADHPITYQIVRNGKRLEKSANAVGRPDETNTGIRYQYQAIPFQGGLLRAIVSAPSAPTKKKMPAVFFIQGYTCGEMVDIDSTHPYRRLTDGLTRAGFVVMRVEKPGVGDCLNTPDCGDIDFKTECNAFESAMLAFKKMDNVDSTQFFVFGHSLGGLITPVLTSKHPWIKGAIVYGTLNRIWGEYLVQMTRLQSEGFGVPPTEIEQSVRAARKIIYELYALKKSPTQLVQEDPSLKPILERDFMWDSKSDRLFTRSLRFNQELDELNPNLLWSQSTCKVLAIYGEADVEALNAEATQSLVKTVNYYHPGYATFKQLPGTDHSFARVGTIEDGYRTKMDPNYAQIMIHQFNPELVRMTVDWLEQVSPAQRATTTLNYTWKKLNTEPYPGKQDDLFFINEQIGWYVNGRGNIYKTIDGGATWTKSFQQPGTFFRCIAFIDSLHGFAGNVGTDYFPNVKDTIPLYETKDGGATWSPVQYKGPYVKGLCAIDIVKESYINHGQIDYRYHIYAVGRVGSPANMMVSHDNGKSFQSSSLDPSCKMLFDIKMFNAKEGFVCAATHEDVAQSHALILYTKDGGRSWEKRYESNRPYETTWKISFPNRDTGYATIQHYNPDPNITQQRIAKTTDGGKTWKELNLCSDHQARQFGIGFIDANHGYVGTLTTGYETRDGGNTWTPIELGRACNKIRIYKRTNGTVYGYAIGVDVFKLMVQP